MLRNARLTTSVMATFLMLGAGVATAQSNEDRIVQQATVVLREAMSTPGNQIPLSMLEDAHGVAIIPSVVKGSFIVGARHGRGLLVVRQSAGVWHAPVFITLTGGNIGWQIGVQSSDIVLVFKTERSIQGLLSGKLTLGADAAAAAGPLGREAGVATDGRLQAEIYTYSRSRGLFAGVSIDGSVVQVDPYATGSYYTSPAPGLPVTIPPAAEQLTLAIANYTASLTASSIVQPVQHAGLPDRVRASESDVLRGQIAQLAPPFYRLLDEQWSSYLALPAELMRGEHPDPAMLQQTIDRFQAVAGDPNYQQLSSRAEFKSLEGLLRHYQHSLSASANELRLPPPPPLR